MKRKVWKCSVTLAILGLLFLPTSCSCEFPFSWGSSGLGITGIVYEWVNASANSNSMVFIDAPSFRINEYYTKNAIEDIMKKIPNDVSIIPMEGAVVSIYGDRRVNSNAEGKVEEFWVVAPGKYKVTIKVAKPGYKEAVQEVDFNGSKGGDYIIVVLLVKESK